MKRNNNNNSIQLLSIIILSISIIVLITSCGAGGAGGGSGGGGGGGGGTTDELCPFTTIENGALQIDNAPSSGTDFSAGLLGTFDRLDSGNIVGGIDWLYTNTGDFSTTSMGTQLISWWSVKGSRNTKLQVTNQSQSTSVSVHIQIFNENCIEIRDFCDQFTVFDTHVYDFSSIVTNTGLTIASGSLAGEEGFVTITPNVNCGTDFRATSFPFLSGDTRISDSSNGFQYGTKMWARGTDTLTTCTETISGSKVLTGTGNCRLKPVLPTEFTDVFSTNSNSDASRSDLIFISLDDNYSSSGYLAIGGSVNLAPTIIDMNENTLSCATRTACYLRVGVNDAIKDSDDPLPAPASLCDASAPGAIIGTPGDDTLSGTSGGDVIIGLGGNDTITGGSGADCIDGGPGNDIINAGSGGDTIYGGSGNDDIEGGPGADNLDGGPGIDSLDGGPGSDTCINGETLTSC
jgi:Ca2+-binding RTX toxin-like protein